MDIFSTKTITEHIHRDVKAHWMDFLVYTANTWMGRAIKRKYISRKKYKKKTVRATDFTRLQIITTQRHTPTRVSKFVLYQKIVRIWKPFDLFWPFCPTTS